MLFVILCAGLIVVGVHAGRIFIVVLRELALVMVGTGRFVLDDVARRAGRAGRLSLREACCAKRGSSGEDSYQQRQVLTSTGISRAKRGHGLHKGVGGLAEGDYFN